MSKELAVDVPMKELAVESDAEPSSAKQALILLFNFAATVSVTLINKVCFARVSFGFPAALCCIHYVVTFIGLEVMYRMGFFEKLQSAPSIRDPQYAVMMLTIGVVTPLNNTSLQLNSVGFYQMFKLLLTPVVLVLQYALDGSMASRTRLVALAVVCVGVLCCSHGELEFSVRGTVAASLWVPLAAVYKVQWGRLLSKYDHCQTAAMMYAILPGATLIQLCISPLVDPPGVSQFAWTPEAVFWIGLSALAAFFVNLSGFLVLGSINALAHVMLGQLKSCAIILGAYMMFGANYTVLQLMGAALAIGAIVFYTDATMKEKSNEIGL